MRQRNITSLIVRRLILAVLAALTLSGISSGVSHAADKQVESITMSPTSRQYRFDAGQSQTGSLTVVNDGTVAYDFIVYARPYWVNNKDYEPKEYEPNITATPKSADAYTWVQFPKTKYRLEAGASTKVDYTISVPATATPGGHYGVIFVETQPEQSGEGAAIVRNKRVGSIMYATVNGIYQMKGEAMGTSIPFWQVEPPLRVSANAKNTGNADFLDTVKLTVKDVFGNVKYTVSNDYVVLPETARKMNFDWKDASWFGLYKVEISQTILSKTTLSTGYVLMMPRFLPAALILVLIVGGVYAWYHRKKH